MSVLYTPQSRVVEEEQVRAGYVVGWRAWWIKGDCWLQSLSYTAHVWPQRARMEARCSALSQRLLGGHRSPDFLCSCGIYALGTLEVLRVGFLAGSSAYLRYALGAVALWGRIIEHAYGYRAEFAYPLMLFVGDPEALGTGYGVPLGRIDWLLEGGTSYVRELVEAERLPPQVLARR